MIVGRLGLTIPLVQAPMAGVSTPALAAAVSQAGGLGSIALGAGDAAAARTAIADVRARTGRPFNVNLFVHAAPLTDTAADAARERAWCEWLRPVFARFGAEPPATLTAPYRSFADDADMLALLLDLRPAVVSFHFGLPPALAIAALRGSGALLLATVTSPAEAALAARAGINAVVAQGIEAGGHRGTFDADGDAGDGGAGDGDDALGTLALTRLLVREGTLPVVAAGGIMDGTGIAAVLALGAVAAQLGTAFVRCPESGADAGYRAALASPAAAHTRLVRAISGRPARGLANRFTALECGAPAIPPYPLAYAAGKALHAAAAAHGEQGYGAHWAGQGAPLARALPAADLVETLRREWRAARTAA